MQKVENYEYELPSDFEDEEIDEDLAFTEEDKKKYAGWFDEDEGAEHGQAAEADFGDLDSEDMEGSQEGEVGLHAETPCKQKMDLAYRYLAAVHGLGVHLTVRGQLLNSLMRIEDQQGKANRMAQKREHNLCATG